MAITEEVKLKVSADTGQAQAGFSRLKKETDGLAASSKGLSFSMDKVTTTLVAVNQGLGVASKVIRLFKASWDFTKEGAHLASLADKTDRLLVDRIQEAVGGTIDKMTIMQEVSKKGADQALADLTKQVDKMGETERAVLQMQTVFTNFWNELKVGAAETLVAFMDLKDAVLGLSPQRTGGAASATPFEKRRAFEVDADLKLTPGTSIKILKGDIQPSARLTREVQEEYRKAVARYNTLTEVINPYAAGVGARIVESPRGTGGAGPEAQGIPTYGGAFQRTTPYGLYGGGYSTGAIGGGISPSGMAPGFGLGGTEGALGGGDAARLQDEFSNVNEYAQEAESMAVNAVGAGIEAAIVGQESILGATKRAVAGQLRTKAVLWGMEAVAAGFLGNFASAAKLGALAVAAGVAANQLGGGSGGGGGPSPTAMPGGGYASAGGGFGGGGSTPIVINVSGGSATANAIAVQQALEQARRQGLLPSGGASRFTS